MSYIQILNYGMPWVNFKLTLCYSTLIIKKIVLQQLIVFMLQDIFFSKMKNLKH